MAKKKECEQPNVRYENGRWITSDGASFNTQTKAENHIEKCKTTSDNGEKTE